MNCPHCDSDMQVIDSRFSCRKDFQPLFGKNITRRRVKCPKCGARKTTYEIPEDDIQFAFRVLNLLKDRTATPKKNTLPPKLKTKPAQPQPQPTAPAQDAPAWVKRIHEKLNMQK